MIEGLIVVLMLLVMWHGLFAIVYGVARVCEHFRSKPQPVDLYGEQS